MDPLEQRKFLHDFANPLSIVKLLLRRIDKMQPTSVDNAELQAQKKIIEQMIQAVQKMEQIHADFKSKIHEKDVA